MYGLPREPDLSGFGLFDLNDDDDEGGEGDKDKPKKKRIKRDLAALRKQKNEPISTNKQSLGRTRKHPKH